MYSEITRFLIFALIGVWNTLFDISIFWLLINSIGKAKVWEKSNITPATFSNIVSFLAANVVSFYLNSNLTFVDSAKKDPSWVRYLVISLISLAISTILMQIFGREKFYLAFRKSFFDSLEEKIPLVQKLGFDLKKWLLLLKISIIVITMLINFFGYRIWVFS